MRFLMAALLFVVTGYAQASDTVLIQPDTICVTPPAVEVRLPEPEIITQYVDRVVTQEVIREVAVPVYLRRPLVLVQEVPVCHRDFLALREERIRLRRRQHDDDVSVRVNTRRGVSVEVETPSTRRGRRGFRARH